MLAGVVLDANKRSRGDPAADNDDYNYYVETIRITFIHFFHCYPSPVIN